MGDTTYWIPAWWNWMDRWGKCITCLEYNHSPCLSCEIPSEIIGIVCLVDGGTTTKVGNMHSAVQVNAASQSSNIHSVTNQRRLQQRNAIRR